MNSAANNPARLFPALTSGRALDVVKIVAAVAMVIDHINHIWWQGSVTSAYLIGRMAFPLFCFAAAAAIVRMDGATDKIYKQAGFLLLCALISEPVSQLTRDPDTVNVLFTLALGLAVAPCVRSFPPVLRMVFYIAACALMAWPNAWEFGFAGMFLPVALAGAIAGRRSDMVGAAVLAAFANFGGYGDLDVVNPAAVMIVVLAAVVAPFCVLWLIDKMQTTSGQARLLPRYALHVFYPLHMLVIWAIGLLIAA